MPKDVHQYALKDVYLWWPWFIWILTTGYSRPSISNVICTTFSIIICEQYLSTSLPKHTDKRTKTNVLTFHVNEQYTTHTPIYTKIYASRTAVLHVGAVSPRGTPEDHITQIHRNLAFNLCVYPPHSKLYNDITDFMATKVWWRGNISTQTQKIEMQRDKRAIGRRHFFSWILSQNLHYLLDFSSKNWNSGYGAIANNELLKVQDSHFSKCKITIKQFYEPSSQNFTGTNLPSASTDHQLHNNASGRNGNNIKHQTNDRKY